MAGSRRYRYKCAVLTGQRKTNSVPACVGKFLKHAASPDKCSRDEIEPASFCFAAVKNYTDSQYRKENHFSAGTLSNYTTSFIPQLWFSSETFSATLQLCFAKHSRFIKVKGWTGVRFYLRSRFKRERACLILDECPLQVANNSRDRIYLLFPFAFCILNKLRVSFPSLSFKDNFMGFVQRNARVMR